MQANFDKATEWTRLIFYETHGHLRLRKRSSRIPKPADLSVFRQLISKGHNVKDFKKKKEFYFFSLWSFSEHKHCQYGADYDYDDYDGYDSIHEGGI